MSSRLSAMLGGALLLVPAVLPMVGANLKDKDDGGAQIDAYDAAETNYQGASTTGSGSGDRWVRRPVCREWITVELTGQMFSGSWQGDIPDCVEELPPPPNVCPGGGSAGAMIRTCGWLSAR